MSKDISYRIAVKKKKGIAGKHEMEEENSGKEN